MKVLLSLILLTISLRLHPQGAVSIGSIDEAIEIALEVNFDYKTYLLNQEVAALELKLAKGYRLPVVTGLFNGQNNIELATTPLPGEIFGQPGQTVDAQFGQQYTYNAGISLTQNLINREAGIQKELSELSLKIASADTDIYKQILKEQVYLYYYTAKLSKQAAYISEEDLKTAEKIFNLTLDRYNQGLIDAITLNNAKINLNRVEQNHLSSLQLEAQCINAMKKLLGLSVEDLIRFDEKDISLPPKADPNVFIYDPNLSKMDLQKEQNHMQIKMSTAALLPSLTLNTYLGRQQFDDEFGMSFNSSDWTKNSYISLNLSVPIFTGFRNTSAIKISKVNYEIISAKKSGLVCDARIDDEQKVIDYHLSRNEASSAKETFDLYDENQQLLFEKQQNGLVSMDAFLSVFGEYLKAESAYLNAMMKVYTNYSKIYSRISS